MRAGAIALAGLCAGCFQPSGRCSTSYDCGPLALCQDGVCVSIDAGRAEAGAIEAGPGGPAADVDFSGAGHGTGWPLCFSSEPIWFWSAGTAMFACTGATPCGSSAFADDPGDGYFAAPVSGLRLVDISGGVVAVYPG